MLIHPSRLPRRPRGLRAAPLWCAFATVVPLALLAAPMPAFAAPRLSALSGTSAAYAEADFSGWIPYITKWLKNGEQYLQYAADDAGVAQLMRVDAKTGKTTPFYDAAKMERALTEAGLAPAVAKRFAHTFRLDLSDDETRVLLSSANDFYAYDLTTGKATRLTNSPKTAKTNESFSPDAKHVAYVSGNNLFVIDVAFDGRKTAPRALTTDGAPGVYNGRLDWVYEEEIYGRGKTDGYAWSADNRHIAFLRLDESPMKPFLLTDELPDPQGVEKQWYPKAGQPNPLVSLRVVDTDPAAFANAPVYANVKGRPQPPSGKKGDVAIVPLTNYADADRLVVRFAWTPTGDKLTYQVTNRTQTFLDLNVFDIKSAKSDPVLREKTAAWVEIIDNPVWLADGTFLWQSDRTGFRHLYHYKADGTLIRAVTKGDWDVRDVYGVDEKTKTVYFAGTEKSVIGQDVCRVSLGGENYARLTQKAGTHAGAFSPNFAYYAERWSDLFNAPQVRLVSVQTGAELRVLDSSDETAGSRVSRFPDSKPELMEVKTHDGFVMNALLLKPANFDPAKKYPVYCPVYGGPGLQTVRNSWGTIGSFERMLASKGYIIWMCDNRSASGRGLQSQWPIYQHMGPGELADVEDGLMYLKKQPWVDASRIGISGWSFGGFLTEYALTHSKSFKIGVAGAGVSDWRLYDTVYTERYMKTPLENPTGYQDTAPANAAENCAGKLLILHGMMDDNVHLQNSIQLIYGLQKAGKDFQMMFYPSPSSRHGIGDPQQSRHLRDLETKFVLENL